MGGGYGGYSGYGGQINYTDYDANGNPNTSSGDVIGAGNRLLSDGTYNYTYDLAGNMLSQTNIATGAAMYFGYDADNRMVSVVMKNGSDQETAAVGYTYDMYSDLIGRTVTAYTYSGGNTYTSTTSNQFVYDLATGQMVLEFNGSTLQSRFLYGPAVDQILAQESVTSNPLYASTDWMATNYQGSVVDELYQQDTEFGVSEFNHVAYNVWGAVTSGNAAQFGYDGTYTDPLTGLQLHGLRWYSTTAQRWTQPDPSGLGPDSNPNRYVGNDPVNETDPTGLADVPVRNPLEEEELRYSLAMLNATGDSPPPYSDAPAATGAYDLWANDPMLRMLGSVSDSIGDASADAWNSAVSVSNKVEQFTGEVATGTRVLAAEDAAANAPDPIGYNSFSRSVAQGAANVLGGVGSRANVLGHIDRDAAAYRAQGVDGLNAAKLAVTDNTLQGVMSATELLQGMSLGPTDLGRPLTAEDKVRRAEGLTTAAMALAFGMPEGEGPLSSAASNEGQLLVGQSGKFSALDALGEVGDNLTPHHMPQAALGFTERAEGGAIVLPQQVHVLTRTYGFGGAQLATSEAATAFRTVLARDIQDLRSLVGSNLNSGIQDLLDLSQAKLLGRFLCRR